MAIDTGPSKKFISKTKLNKKSLQNKKLTFKHKQPGPQGFSSAGPSRGPAPNPMPGRMNANIGFDY